MIKDLVIRDWYHDCLDQLMDRTPNSYEPDLLDLVAYCRGWLPLQTGENMTVEIGEKEYEITRVK